jgi:hypothetical protein
LKFGYKDLREVDTVAITKKRVPMFAHVRRGVYHVCTLYISIAALHWMVLLDFMVVGHLLFVVGFMGYVFLLFGVSIRGVGRVARGIRRGMIVFQVVPLTSRITKKGMKKN